MSPDAGRGRGRGRADPVRAVGLVAALGLAALPSGCERPEGCLGGDDSRCVPPSPCAALVAPSCAGALLEVRRVAGPEDRPAGLDADAARGDLLLRNDRVTVVIDEIAHPHQLAPSGGNLVDLVPAGGGDALNLMTQIVGILPEDAVRYRRLEVIDARPELVAVVARGFLDGRPEVSVVTRYELRPCEPGLRVRTELHHGGSEEEAFYFSDGFYWGGREATPFVPLRGQGFLHPDLDLLEIDRAFRSFPFLAAQSHAEPVAYSLVSCDRAGLDGFQSATVSAAGLPRRVTRPGEALVLDRFVGVGATRGVAGAVDVAAAVRGSLRGERWVRVTGRVVTSGGLPVGGDERLASVLLYEPGDSDAGPDDPATRRPWSQVVPDAGGRYEAVLPAGRRFRASVAAFGRELAGAVSFDVSGEGAAVPDVVVPPAGLLSVRVTRADGGSVAPLRAEVVLTPTGATTPESVSGTLFGFFEEDECAPWLGPPYGGSPACNRALLDAEGTAELAVPAGTYWVYATHGPFWTIARERVELAAGGRAEVALALAPLPGLPPEGTLSADFHVHAGASFDSDLPELDRARTFLSQGIDVIAATDHDVVTSYERALAELDAGALVHVLPGVEATGQIPFLRPPGSDFPHVIGHFNFWPLRHDPALSRNGAPPDELLEPGALFDVMEGAFSSAGVRQLNHPFAEIELGRDQGYLSAIGYDPRVPIPAGPASTAAGQLRRRPDPLGHSNLDHDVQEVMNGPSTLSFLRYRALWFSFLDQGILRAGTANSDSHTLANEVLGSPRTLVLGAHTVPELDEEAFDRDVRAGRMVGTNGPVVLVSLGGRDGREHGPSLEPFEPVAGAELAIEVRAAPWVPVEEVRVIVNGRVVWTVAAAGLEHPADPFGTAGTTRLRARVPLAALLADVPAGADAWLVVEAGMPLWPAADVDDDGIVDTTDNDGDGDIDQDDRDDFEDEEYQEPPRPPEPDSRFHLHVLVPGTWPTGFTNPLLVDRAGDGWTAPGLSR